MELHRGSWPPLALLKDVDRGFAFPEADNSMWEAQQLGWRWAGLRADEGDRQKDVLGCFTPLQNYLKV